MDNTVTPLGYDSTTGALSVLAGAPSVSALPDGTAHAAGGGGAEIVVSNDGRFAYASVRMTGESKPHPLATENLLENTDGVLRHYPCSLGAAACCLLFMLTRATLMTSSHSEGGFNASEGASLACITRETNPPPTPSN